jgi:hypothetical protein
MPANSVQSGEGGHQEGDRVLTIKSRLELVVQRITQTMLRLDAKLYPTEIRDLAVIGADIMHIAQQARAVTMENMDYVEALEFIMGLHYKYAGCSEHKRVARHVLVKYGHIEAAPPGADESGEKNGSYTNEESITD